MLIFLHQIITREELNELIFHLSLSFQTTHEQKINQINSYYRQLEKLIINLRSKLKVVHENASWVLSSGRNGAGILYMLNATEVPMVH